MAKDKPATAEAPKPVETKPEVVEVIDAELEAAIAANPTAKRVYRDPMTKFIVVDC